MTSQVPLFFTSIRKPFGAAVLLLAASLSAPVLLRAEPADAALDAEVQAGDSDPVASLPSARIRALDGSADIERYDDDSIEDAAVNSPIYAGDSVKTVSGRVEVQFPNGTLVRIDQGSQITFQSIPGDGETDEDEATLIQVSDGRVRIDVRGAAPRKGDFQIDTPATSVYLLANGSYRIDIEDRDGATRVSTFRGVAEVVGDEGSVMLRSGQRTLVEEHGEPDDPRTFNTATGDEFDDWVAERAGEYKTASRRSDEQIDEAEIPDPVRPYYGELSHYGRWVSIPQYGPCWIPAGAGSGWRPYYNGYWAYGPSGAFWVSYDPWGWAPYRYGRWSWNSGYGWVWIPGRVFSGAWVSWYYGPSYVGWCPLDYWNRPCWTGRGFGYSSIDFHCWNFVSYTNIYVRHVTKVYVNPTIVRPEIVKGGGVVVRHPVRIRPTEIVRNPRTPALVVRKARNLGPDAVIDPSTPRDRVAKRAFRDKEREVVDTIRRSPRPVKAGSSIDRTGRTPARPGGEGVVGRGRAPSKDRAIEPRTPRTHDGGGKLSGEAGGRSGKDAPRGRPAKDDKVERRRPQADRPPPRTHGPPSREPSSPPQRERRGRSRSSLVPESSDASGNDGGAPGSPDESLREFMRETGRRPRTGSTDESGRTDDRSRDRDPQADRDRDPQAEQGGGSDARGGRGRDAQDDPRAREDRGRPANPKAERPRSDPPLSEARGTGRRAPPPQAERPRNQPKPKTPPPPPPPKPQPKEDSGKKGGGKHGK